MACYPSTNENHFRTHYFKHRLGPCLCLFQILCTILQGNSKEIFKFVYLFLCSPENGCLCRKKPKVTFFYLFALVDFAQLFSTSKKRSSVDSGTLSKDTESEPPHIASESLYNDLSRGEGCFSFFWD